MKLSIGDLFKAVHNIGNITNRDIQMKSWTELIQDFVDLSEGKVKLKTLFEFIENISNKSIERKTMFVNIDDGKRALKELLADESLIIGRVGAKCGNVHLVSGNVWITDNALVAKTNQNYQFMFFLLNTFQIPV